MAEEANTKAEIKFLHKLYNYRLAFFFAVVPFLNDILSHQPKPFLPSSIHSIITHLLLSPFAFAPHPNARSSIVVESTASPPKTTAQLNFSAIDDVVVDGCISGLCITQKFPSFQKFPYFQKLIKLRR